MRKVAVRLPVEEKQRVVLAVLAGELTAAEGHPVHHSRDRTVARQRSPASRTCGGRTLMPMRVRFGLVLQSR